MKKYIFSAIPLCLFVLGLTTGCKKDPEPDPFAFLKGTWQYENGAECLFDVATKTAKGTKVPTNNVFGFVIGEVFWKDVVSTGADKWEYQQLVRYTDGKTMAYVKSTAVKQDANTLATEVPGLGKGVLKRVQ